MPRPDAGLLLTGVGVCLQTTNALLEWVDSTTNHNTAFNHQGMGQLAMGGPSCMASLLQRVGGTHMMPGLVPTSFVQSPMHSREPVPGSLAAMQTMYLMQPTADLNPQTMAAISGSLLGKRDAIQMSHEGQNAAEANMDRLRSQYVH